MASSTGNQGGIGQARIARLRKAEAKTFRAARPKSEAAFGKGIAGFFGGVPMHWMTDWPTPFPIMVDRARGAMVGSDAYLTKPFTKDSLLRTVREHTAAALAK